MIRVLIADEERLLAAVRAGALAYLSKTAGVDQVVESARAAARGKRAGATTRRQVGPRDRSPAPSA